MDRMKDVLHMAKSISNSRSRMNVVIRNIEDRDQQYSLVTEVRFLDKCIDELLKEVIKCLGQ